ncbi:MAG: UDP-N-acetylmuramoyl-L-alanyl-D-glutamate--2,6-diaminopimelate ligase [Verrucomicrobia bacterium]|nr:UDP-N-acetylmuramoyl-L-alanyl-D-glutamate--2,6-diaminopimelate ligase [Verrucomicrobiota bacterium]
MKLTEVMAGVPVRSWEGSRQAEVSSLAYDARRVSPGSVFCTWKGHQRDGHAFVPDALQRGAVAVVAERRLADLPVPNIRVESGRRALGRMAANFYGHPSRHLQVVGITGTNGKTSTSMLLQSLLEAGGIRCGLLGTVANDTGHGRMPASHTTPEALDLQQLLAEMRENGCRAASLEVSSHALDQGRTEGVDFAGAVFTNLGRDHLDYHRTMEAYEQAKSVLFRGLRPGAFAAVNLDDPCGVRMAAACCPGARILRYGLEKGDVRVADLKMGIQGSSFRLVTPEGEFPATLPWLGRFNVSNALAAASAALLAGVPVEKIAATLGRAPSVPGRMEAVPGSGEITVLVDYAHTADAIEAALATLRPITRGSLWIVVGAGGDRDKGKRPKMAAAAARLADRVILTSDNPRSEEPAEILREMAVGLPKGAAAQKMENRAEAIRTAVRSAGPGDVVLVAGKGHEETQEIRGEKIPFSDRREVEKALAERSRA